MLTTNNPLFIDTKCSPFAEVSQCQAQKKKSKQIFLISKITKEHCLHSFRMRIAVKINSTSMDSSTPWFTSNPVTQSAHFTLTSSSLKRSSISNAHKEKQKSTLYSRNASQSSFVLFKNRLKN